MRDFVKECYHELVRKAIQEGKLFELLFTANGKQALGNIPERELREIVKKELERVRL